MESNNTSRASGDVEAQPGARGARPSTVSARMKYYAKLAVSRNPVQFSKDYKDVQESDEDAAESSLLTARFRSAAWRIREGVSFKRHAKGVAGADGADRFAAVVALERKLEQHPHKEALLAALKRRANNDYSGFMDKLANELFILGQRVFDLFTPKSLHSHTIFFTIIFTLLVTIPFYYMAAEFPRYELDVQNIGPTVVGYGPDALVNWMTKTGDAWRFNEKFVTMWGARNLPKMRGEWQFYRWFTSLVLHLDFRHLFNNLILFLLFSTHLEHKYGTWRIALLTLLAGLGGNFLSAAFEDACIVVVGASGCCFGLMGLFVADMILNFETVSFPILRMFFIIILVILNIWTVITTEGISNISHLGGFIAGLFPSFIFLPNMKWQRYEVSFPYLGAITMAIFYVILPIYLYLKRIPDTKDLACGHS